MITKTRTSTVCVVGAGYVGLPLSCVLSETYRTVSFDVDEQKVKALFSEFGSPTHFFTSDPSFICDADFILICVPTPLSQGNRPDMSYIKAAATIVGQHMKKGAIVIVESSVYPGATEELFKPILEHASGFRYPQDFKLAYSPERISPGDSEHSVNRLTKIVSACDVDTLDKVADLYRHVTPNIYKAPDIRTAEAAKLVENTQRDLDIAFVNELSMIFERMGLNTTEVLNAAATKWNFRRFNPGLVGGYCIPVVPYFLAQKAEENGYHPAIIHTGRAINDRIPKHIVDMTVKSLNKAGKVIKGSRVLIMGLSYKENVSDTRETPVRNVIKELREYDIDIYGYDPLVNNSGEDHLNVQRVEDLANTPLMDAIIITVVHDAFKEISIYQLLRIMKPVPVIIDLRGYFFTPEILTQPIIYKCM